MHENAERLSPHQYLITNDECDENPSSIISGNLQPNYACAHSHPTQRTRKKQSKQETKIPVPLDLETCSQTTPLPIRIQYTATLAALKARYVPCTTKTQMALAIWRQTIPFPFASRGVRFVSKRIPIFGIVEVVSRM